MNTFKSRETAKSTSLGWSNKSRVTIARGFQAKPQDLLFPFPLFQVHQRTFACPCTVLSLEYPSTTPSWQHAPTRGRLLERANNNSVAAPTWTHQTSIFLHFSKRRTYSTRITLAALVTSGESGDWLASLAPAVSTTCHFERAIRAKIGLRIIMLGLVGGETLSAADHCCELCLGPGYKSGCFT